MINNSQINNILRWTARGGQTTMKIRMESKTGSSRDSSASLLFVRAAATEKPERTCMSWDTNIKAIRGEALKDKKLKICWIPSKPGDERQEETGCKYWRFITVLLQVLRGIRRRMCTGCVCFKTDLGSFKKRERESNVYGSVRNTDIDPKAHRQLTTTPQPAVSMSIRICSSQLLILSRLF